MTPADAALRRAVIERLTKAARPGVSWTAIRPDELPAIYPSGADGALLRIFADRKVILLELFASGEPGVEPYGEQCSFRQHLAATGLDAALGALRDLHLVKVKD